MPRTSSSNSSTPSPLTKVESSSPPVSPLTLTNGNSYIASPPLDPIIENVRADHALPATHRQRVSSISSISFKTNGFSSPATLAKGKAKSRIRGSSPPPASRFQHHVSFDNFAGGEPTEKNTISFTLNVKHKGYQFKRRSRTFMVGIDENDYSDIALSWMLEELVDDGDEIICLRVVEKESRQYQKDAGDMMRRIQARNDDNKAISIVLEYAVGKVHTTFQKMIQIYEPAMLIVGTKGRSLGGFQGLMTNSFSKWCLQYSPIPVVVVRPTEKRMKKKLKRDADPTRQNYARILEESGIAEHETGIDAKHSVFEATNAPDIEAHAVAAALGLPAQFDPTMKPYIDGNKLQKIESAKSDATSVSQGSLSPDSRPSSPRLMRKISKSKRSESPSVSGDESSEGDDDDEGEFEAVSGNAALEHDHDLAEIERKKRLHEMEVGEAQALAAGGRKASNGSLDSAGSLPTEEVGDENDDEDEE